MLVDKLIITQNKCGPKMNKNHKRTKTENKLQRKKKEKKKKLRPMQK